MEERIVKDSSAVLQAEVAKLKHNVEQFLADPAQHHQAKYNEELTIILNSYGNYEAVPLHGRRKRRH
jgi:hypothetical protein